MGASQHWAVVHWGIKQRASRSTLLAAEQPDRAPPGSLGGPRRLPSPRVSTLLPAPGAFPVCNLMRLALHRVLCANGCPHPASARRYMYAEMNPLGGECWPQARQNKAAALSMVQCCSGMHAPPTHRPPAHSATTTAQWPSCPPIVRPAALEVPPSAVLHTLCLAVLGCALADPRLCTSHPPLPFPCGCCLLGCLLLHPYRHAAAAVGPGWVLPRPQGPGSE